MSDNTAGGVYCSVCHKRRPATHFEDRPDHAAGGPKLTLAERRELLDGSGEALDAQAGTHRPRPPRAAISTPRPRPRASDASEGEGEAPGWVAWAVGGAIVAAVGLFAWLGRNGGEMGA